MTVSILFPGQGSQFVGMGEDLFDRRSDLLVDVADEVLGWSLRDLCLEGPEEDLTRTEHAQPALFALSYALWLEAHQAGLSAQSSAGHSLGEYTALAAAGVLSYEDGLRAVAKRGLAMADAAGLEASGMSALIGANPEKAEAIVAANNQQGGRLQVANLNAPGQVVVAGAQKDIEWVGEHAREHGVRRAIPLKVAGAFHSSFMEPAATRVLEALAPIEFGEFEFPVWSNTTAKPHETRDIAATLARQVVSPVRFEDSLRSMAASGVDAWVHIGPGDVTAGMARRTVEDASVFVISKTDDIAEVVASVSSMAQFRRPE